MHTLESFSVVADVLGTPRKVTFDSLTGMSIAGLSAAEAKALVGVLEQGTGSKPLPTPAPRPVNHAKWGPKVQTQPEQEPVSGEIETSTPDKAPSTAEAAPEPTVAAEVAEQPQSEPEPTEAPAQDHDLGALDASAPVELTTLEADPSVDTSVGDDDVEDVPKVAPADVVPDEPAPTKKRKKKWEPGLKPAPRPEELREQKREEGRHKVGDEHEGSTIVEIKEHPDKGRLLIRADGWRVRVDMDNKEVARMEGLPPDQKVDLPTAAELKNAEEEKAQESSPEAEGDSSNVPDLPEEMMQTKSSRDLVSHLLNEQGVARDDLIDVCIALKAKGAQAFAPTRGDDGVRRRVNAALTVLGLDAA